MTHVEGDGKEFAEVARTLGLEGVVAKRTGSPYLPGRRSPDWRKIKLTNTQDCVILGWTPGQGGRSGTFGALLVGAYDDGELRGSARSARGSPIDARPRPRGRSSRSSDRRPPIDDPELARVKGATFVEPEIVCEVEYLEITKSTKKMRAPVVQGPAADGQDAARSCVLGAAGATKAR